MTSVVLSEEIANRLIKLKKVGDKYDDVIKMLIDHYEKTADKEEEKQP